MEQGLTRHLMFILSVRFAKNLLFSDNSAPKKCALYSDRWGRPIIAKMTPPKNPFILFLNCFNQNFFGVSEQNTCYYLVAFWF